MKRAPLALLLACAPFARAAGDKAAEVPRLGTIGAPLASPSVSVPGAGTLGTGLSIPSLPDTKLAGSAGMGTVTPATNSPMPADATRLTPGQPPGPSNPGPSAAAPGAPPSGPPYFVEALVKLGAPREAALKLAAAQEARLASVENGAVALARAREAADLVARTTEGREGYSLSKQQKALLVVAAALRGAGLAKEAGTEALLAELGRALGFAPASALALATGRSPAQAATLSLDASFFANWGERLAYFEKAAVFTATGAGVKLTESPAEVRELSRDPAFKLLPLTFQSEVRRLVARLDGADGPRGPPAGGRALAEAGAQAGADGAPAAVNVVMNARGVAARALAAMAATGWAVFPGEAILPEADAQHLISKADANWPTDKVFRTWELFDGRNWRVNRVHDEAVVAIAQRMLGALTQLLQAATPGEGLVPIGVELRFGNDRPTGLHVDGSYVTATLAIRGPGTLVMEETAGSAKITRARTNEVAVITNADREFLTGIEGTVHSTPPPTDPKRLVFIIRYRAARTGELNDQRQGAAYKRMEEKNKGRVGRIARAIQAREPSAKPEATGLKGIWSKLFE